MEVGNEDWRRDKKTLKDRFEFLVNNEFGSDITFLLRNGDQIFAHTFPLLANSPVFAAMFHGPLATKKGVIEILDCDNEETFVEFLRYLYCEHCELNWENVFDILYVAKKYLVSSLVEECVNFLSQDINVNNALLVLQQASKFAEEELLQKCVKYICSNVSQILESEDFLNLDLDTLKIILKQDELNIKEIELFKFVQFWCDHKLAGAERETEHLNAERELLSDALYLIRFPVMSALDFAENCAPSGFLTPIEYSNILCYLVRKKGCTTENDKLISELIIPHGFSARERLLNIPANLKCCSRAFSGSGPWGYSAGHIDAVRFHVNKKIKLWGVTVFGNALQNVVKQLYIESDKQRFKLEIKKPYETVMIPESVLSADDSFRVFFGEAVTILPQKNYDLCMEMSGPYSKSSSYTKEKIVDGTIFTFLNSAKSSNSTTGTDGQFPELWYAETCHSDK